MFSFELRHTLTIEVVLFVQSNAASSVLARIFGTRRLWKQIETVPGT